jgi:hypothetical protein
MSDSQREEESTTEARYIITLAVLIRDARGHSCEEERIELIKENWPAFYVLGLSILTAIGKTVIRKWVWKR